MIEIARAEAVSSVGPEDFHAKWCDLESHPEWAPSMASFTLDGPLEVGVGGVSVSAEGRRARFVVTEITPGRTYADRTELDGGSITVHHEARPRGVGSALTLTAFVDGLRAPELARELAGVQAALERDLASLISLLESAPR